MFSKTGHNHSKLKFNQVDNHRGGKNTYFSIITEKVWNEYNSVYNLGYILIHIDLLWLNRTSRMVTDYHLFIKFWG